MTSMVGLLVLALQASPGFQADEMVLEANEPLTLLQWSGHPEVAERAEGKFKDATIATDRPDFTESSTTVGKNVLQIESGYTFVHNRTEEGNESAHSAPEMLFRFGMLQEWFEIRIACTYLWESAPNGLGANDYTADYSDLYVGCKLALTPQAGMLPELAIVPQMLVPMGSSLSGEQLLPGMNLLYGWDINDRWTCAGSTQINRTYSDSPIFFLDPESLFLTPNDDDEFHMLFAQSFTVGYSIIEDRLGMYTEWFCFIPIGHDDPAIGNEQYLNGGFTLLITPNMQEDIRVGCGLNDHSNDLFSGVGLSWRM